MILYLNVYELLLRVKFSYNFDEITWSEVFVVELLVEIIVMMVRCHAFDRT